MTAALRHNDAVKPILKAMMTATNLDSAEMLILAESLVAGTFLLVVKLGAAEPVMDVFANGVRERLAQARLANIETEGQA